jgi:hypothetical protein
VTQRKYKGSGRNSSVRKNPTGPRKTKEDITELLRKLTRNSGKTKIRTIRPRIIAALIE